MTPELRNGSYWLIQLQEGEVPQIVLIDTKTFTPPHACVWEAGSSQILMAADVHRWITEIDLEMVLLEADAYAEFHKMLEER